MNLQEQLQAANRARRFFERQPYQSFEWEIEKQILREERVIKTSTGNTRVLIYVPLDSIVPPYPVYVHFHGGGFVLGKAEMDDFYCRIVAGGAACLVVNVDYHLAPEHKFPAQLEEGYDVIDWLYKNPGALNIRREHIAIGGFSAGGNMAAAICLLAKERKDFSLIHQILGYPLLDLCTDPFEKKTVQGKPVITPEMATFFSACYLKSREDACLALASPVLARDLTGLPPACVITAEYDVLAVEGEQYALKLRQAGVPVVYKNYKGCDHIFTAYGPEEAAKDAFDLICAELRNAFAGKKRSK
ncbi:alpha/beta hydrolase [Moorella sulfitireducens]|uniref:alpha/beta hydrolase n=1 Tax=Neomoorella sulfitireducens TaxID=2972948 RepID=UPI0021AC7170|nr:alpha/beta hydrolase [Moorella sulfitireducens]